MGWFKCFVRGERFPGVIIGESEEIGFYTYRYVEASSLEEAEKVALDLLRREPKLKLPDGVQPSESAKVYFEEIVEVSPEDIPEVQAGFAWYVEGSE